MGTASAITPGFVESYGYVKAEAFEIIADAEASRGDSAALRDLLHTISVMNWERGEDPRGAIARAQLKAGDIAGATQTFSTLCFPDLDSWSACMENIAQAQATGGDFAAAKKTASIMLSTAERAPRVHAWRELIRTTLDKQVFTDLHAKLLSISAKPRPIEMVAGLAWAVGDIAGALRTVRWLADKQEAESANSAATKKSN